MGDGGCVTSSHLAICNCYRLTNESRPIVDPRASLLIQPTTDILAAKAASFCPKLTESSLVVVVVVCLSA